MCLRPCIAKADCFGRVQAANGQPRFALGGASSAFGQYHEGGTSQQPGSRLQGMAGQSAGRQPALFKGGSRQQDSEESMSQQLQISSSSDGGNQTAEASAALQSLYEIARGSQPDGATSKPLGGASYTRAEKGQREPSGGREYSGVCCQWPGAQCWELYGMLNCFQYAQS